MTDIKLLSAIVAIGAVLPVMAMPEDVSCIDGQANEDIRIYPESGNVDDLDQIILTVEDSKKFGAFVYMPSLYSINQDGSIGEKISTCELMDVSARGKDTLRFRVLNPPTCSGKYAFLIKDNSFSLIPDSEVGPAMKCGDSRECPELKVKTPGRSFINYPVNLRGDTLRILHISNSYGGNVLYYVADLLKAADIDVSKVLVERLMYSSGSFKSWCDVAKDENANKYLYYKMAGGLETTLKGYEADKNDGSIFRRMLEENKWDLIILNQASTYAPYYEDWDSTGSGGYLPQLLSIIREYQPEVPVGFLLIHSYAEDYNSNTQHWSTMERWEKICDGVRWLQSAYDVDFVVPYGTAIQNLRLTGYNNTYDLTGDGTHLAGGLAQYAAGCCYFESVFSPRFNITVYGNSLRLPDPEVQFSDRYDGCVIPVDDGSAEIAQKAAFLASHNMYEVRSPYLADLRDYVYGEALNQDCYCTEYDFSFLEGVDDIRDLTPGPPYCIYGPSGILIGKTMSEEEWIKLPAGLYIRNGEKIFKLN